MSVGLSCGSCCRPTERTNLGQLKILQEVITLTVFAPFVVVYMQQSLKFNFLRGSTVHHECRILRLRIGNLIPSFFAKYI